MIKRLDLQFTEKTRGKCKYVESMTTQFAMQISLLDMDGNVVMDRSHAEWIAQHSLWVELYREPYELLCRIHNYAKMPESLRADVAAAITDLSPPKGASNG